MFLYNILFFRIAMMMKFMDTLVVVFIIYLTALNLSMANARESVHAHVFMHVVTANCPPPDVGHLPRSGGHPYSRFHCADGAAAAAATATSSSATTADPPVSKKSKGKKRPRGSREGINLGAQQVPCPSPRATTRATRTTFPCH